MGLNRRQLILGGVSAPALVASPAPWAQTAKATRKLVVGQSVPLTGAAEQIGLAYLNATLFQLPGIFFYDPSAGCAACPANPLLISSQPNLYNATGAVVNLAVLPGMRSLKTIPPSFT